MQEPAVNDPLIGTVIADRYRVDAKIGDGGMGCVYRVEHTHMRKRLALKVLHRDLCAFPEVVARFEREAMAAANIEHPNVANATDFGKLADGTFYLVLEYVEGLDLRALLQRDRVLDPARAVHVVLQMLGALGRAHELGIVHRDLKPENILLVEKDHDPEFVKVLDFGIARVPVGALGTPSRSAGEAKPLTRAGTVYGTPEYMAPEQALGEVVDGRADLYAVGVLLFEMLSGVRPYDDPDKIALLGAHVSKPIPSLSDRARGFIPDGLEALVTRALAKSPDDRFRTAAEFAEALLSLGFHAPEPIGRHPTRAAEPRSEPEKPGPFLLVERASAKVAVAPSSSRDGELATTAQAPTIPAPPPAASRPEPAGAAPPSTQTPLATSSPAPSSSRLPWAIAIVSVCVALAALVAVRRPASPPAAVVPAASGAAVASLAAPSGSASVVPAAPLEPRELALRALGRIASGEVQAGLDDLEALAAAHPKDPTTLRALAQAYARGGKLASALSTLDRLAVVAPDAWREAQVAALYADALADASSADGAVAALAGSPKAVRLLVDLAFDEQAKPATRARAAKALRDPKVGRALPSSLRALVELREATSCVARRFVLERRKADLDAEAAPVLRAMTRATCGVDHKQPCWPCFREKELEALARSLEAGPAK